MAWVKANFPLAFYAAMITYDPSKFALYRKEAESRGINILGPHINLSQKDTFIDIKNHALRIGLNQIKGLGSAAVDVIINNRGDEYISVNDFFNRAVGRAVNKRIIETLINNDCFEGVPFEFNDDTISENSVLFGKKPLFLSRGELLKWYSIYYDMKNAKPEKNFVLRKEELARKFQEDKQLKFKKDGTLIVPLSKLPEFGMTGSNTDGSFTEEDLKKLTPAPRGSRVSGRLLNKDISKLNLLLKPFLKKEQDILNSKLTNTQMYWNDIFNNDLVSFRCHPFTLSRESIVDFDHIELSSSYKLSGLIANIENRSTKSKKLMMNVTIVTPHNIKEVTFWENEKSPYLKVGKYVTFDFIFPKKEDKDNIQSTNNKQDTNDKYNIDDRYIKNKRNIQYYSNNSGNCLCHDKIVYRLSVEKNKYSNDLSYLPEFTEREQEVYDQFLKTDKAKRENDPRAREYAEVLAQMVYEDLVRYQAELDKKDGFVAHRNNIN